MYQTYDGVAAGIQKLVVEDTGAWTIQDLQGRTIEQGTLPIGELRSYLDFWRDLASRRANGWSEPQFGGCTNQIHMAAVRTGGIEIHYREQRDRRDPDHRTTIDALVAKLKAWIPRLL